MKRYYILYRFFGEGQWKLYNVRQEGMTRKEMKEAVNFFKEDKDMEMKILSESLFALLKK